MMVDKDIPSNAGFQVSLINYLVAFLFVVISGHGHEDHFLEAGFCWTGISWEYHRKHYLEKLCEKINP